MCEKHLPLEGSDCYGRTGGAGKSLDAPGSPVQRALSSIQLWQTCKPISQIGKLSPPHFPALTPPVWSAVLWAVSRARGSLPCEQAKGCTETPGWGLLAEPSTPTAAAQASHLGCWLFSFKKTPSGSQLMLAQDPGPRTQWEGRPVLPQVTGGRHLSGSAVSCPPPFLASQSQFSFILTDCTTPGRGEGQLLGNSECWSGGSFLTVLLPASPGQGRAPPSPHLVASNPVGPAGHR